MEIEKQYTILAQRLRELREEKEIPQFKVAQDLGSHKNTYQGYESAVRRLSLEALDKVAFYFNVSIDYLLGRTDIRSPYPYNDEDVDFKDEIKEELKRYAEFLVDKMMKDKTQEV